MPIEAFIFDSDTFSLKVIDQTQLPTKLVYVDIHNTFEGYEAIKKMWVRGAPCIAAVGCLSVIVELNKLESSNLRYTTDLLTWLEEKSDYLISSRPTAVNLKQALKKLLVHVEDKLVMPLKDVIDHLNMLCIQAIDIGKKANRDLGSHGVEELLHLDEHRLSILTHCNTGALATVGHGTALGVIRSLHEIGKLEMTYCTETRPYNQGARLTAWELYTDGIPSTLIADSMVAYLMETRRIHAVIVGADRVAANGDTANKIGTLQIAVLARHYQVPFYVAAPSQSVDLELDNGEAIVIEQRPADEIRKIGPVQLAPEGMKVWNPCFDVTPAGLISRIITEFGVVQPNDLRQIISEHSRNRGREKIVLF